MIQFWRIMVTINFYWLTGTNSESNSLFSYTADRPWSSYRNTSFEPIKYSKNLTELFPNETLRQQAISACFSGSTTDPNPEERRECYYDFRVTLDTSFAADTIAATAQLLEYSAILGKKIHLNFTRI